MYSIEPIARFLCIFCSYSEQIVGLSSFHYTSTITVSSLSMTHEHINFSFPIYTLCCTWLFSFSFLSPSAGGLRDAGRAFRKEQ